MSNLTWQFYWHRWHLGWDSVQDSETRVKYNYLFIGPLQIRWYS